MPIMDPAMMLTTQTSPDTSPVMAPAVMPPTETTTGQEVVPAVMPPTQNLPGQDAAAATPAVMTDMVIYGTYDLNSLLNADGLTPLTVSLLAAAQIPPPTLPPTATGPTTLFPPIVIAFAPPPPENAPPGFVPTPTLIIRFNPNGPVGIFGPPILSITQGTGISAITITIDENYKVTGGNEIFSTVLYPGLPTPVKP